MKNVRHCGIVVTSMDRSLHFYRDLLGLKVVKVMDESGPYIDNILALEHVQVTTVKLAAEDGSTNVELLEFQSHPRQSTGPREACTVGPSHVAFTVEDLNATYQRLSQAGVSFSTIPQRSPNGDVSLTYCIDPDGTLVELVEDRDVDKAIPHPEEQDRA